MEELQRAIENITHFNKRFPKEELALISANRDEAVPYLRDAVLKAIKEKDMLDESYTLHLYGIYLLAQFQDRDFFPELMKLAMLPEDTLDDLIGDTLTEDLGSILYNTYNGDLELVKKVILNKKVSDFARAQMLDMMGQLYQDQTLGKEELQDFLKEIVYGKKSIGDFIYSEIAELICRCHLTELIPELRRLYQDGRVDRYVIGGYDDSLDLMFSYGKRDGVFCKSPIDTIRILSGWAMFENGDSTGEDHDDGNTEENDEKENRNKMDDLLDRKFFGLMDEFRALEPRRVVKVGRNDPCPCGSGKKYKQCCLKKSQLSADGVESPQEQEKWLANYPPSADQRVEGRVYIEDLYSSESITLDKQLYLALKERYMPKWSPEPAYITSRRKKRYLLDAYRKFQEIVSRDNIQNFSEFDSKYSVHYLCAEWIDQLLKLLEEEDADGMLSDVRKTCAKMGKK